MKKLISTLIAALVTLYCYTQETQGKYSIGLNLPPLIGKTIDLRFENNLNPHWTLQLSAGAMIDNHIKGSVYKVYDGLAYFNNSGFFGSAGIRYYYHKEVKKSALFGGVKIINGYFDQSGRYEEGHNQVSESGYFIATGIEAGVSWRLSDKFKLDTGLQYSPVIYADRQVSRFFSVLPGIGAIADLQGILAFKYFINRSKTD